MFDRVLNRLVDYLGCFVKVPRGIQGNVWYMPCWLKNSLQTWKFTHSEIIHGSKTLKLTKGWQRLKKNDQPFNLMFLVFLSFSSFQCPRQQVSQTEVARASFCTHQTSGMCAGVCAWNGMHQMEKSLYTINLVAIVEDNAF